MLIKFQKFHALDSEKKRMFLQAYRMLGSMRFAIMTTSFKRLVAGLNVHREVVAHASLDAESLATAHTIGWAVRTASCFTPWQSTCLVQVLAAQRMLQQRRIAGVFYVGASTNSELDQKQSLSAHAWLKCGNEFITGESGHEKYTVVSSFSWQ